MQVATASLVWSLLEKPEVVKHEYCKSVSILLTSVVYTSKNTTVDGQEDLQQFILRYACKR